MDLYDFSSQDEIIIYQSEAQMKFKILFRLAWDSITKPPNATKTRSALTIAAIKTRWEYSVQNSYSFLRICARIRRARASYICAFLLVRFEKARSKKHTRCTKIYTTNTTRDCANAHIYQNCVVFIYFERSRTILYITNGQGYHCR